MPNFHTAGSIDTVDAVNNYAAADLRRKYDAMHISDAAPRPVGYILYMLSKIKIEIFFSLFFLVFQHMIIMCVNCSVKKKIL